MLVEIKIGFQGSKDIMLTFKIVLLLRKMRKKETIQSQKDKVLTNEGYLLFCGCEVSNCGTVPLCDYPSACIRGRFQT